jgi:FAD/FMN-containing dehydrogenase
MEQLIEFLNRHPDIHYATPSSPDFNDLRPGYVINDTAPAMIVRPRSADDVAGLVSVLKASNLPFSVRVGGNDMFGRYQLKDGITIDLREIAYVNVDKENQTARIGGGVLVSNVLEALDPYGLVVPHPVISSVGFVGWATHGGYGLLSAEFGMGVDQILQAKVVDANAAIRDADEDMLSVIRGGGGALGVIVELTIKVYPLTQV